MAGIETGDGSILQQGLRALIVTKRTARDEVWHEALQYALVDESFKLEQLQAELAVEVSDRTVRDTINTMVELDWLSKPSPRAHSWDPGPRLSARTTGPVGPEPDDTDDEHPFIITDVETVRTYRVNRLSNSSNLVAEDGDTHILATHGTIEENIIVPYVDGNPANIQLPRVSSRIRTPPRILVCRSEQVVRDDTGVVGIRTPLLHTGDMVPVDWPLTEQTDDGVMRIETESSETAPLVLFENVDELVLLEDSFKDEQRHAVEVVAIEDGAAKGTLSETSSLNTYRRSRSQTQNDGDRDDDQDSLAKLAEGTETTVQTQQRSSNSRRYTDEWKERKAEFMSGVNRRYR